MMKFKELLNDNDKVVLDISIYYKDDTVVVSGIKFDVYDYIEGNDYIKLYNIEGTELILPIDSLRYYEEDETWQYEQGDLQVYIIIDKKN